MYRLDLLYCAQANRCALSECLAYTGLAAYQAWRPQLSNVAGGRLVYLGAHKLLKNTNARLFQGRRCGYGGYGVAKTCLPYTNAARNI